MRSVFDSSENLDENDISDLRSQVGALTIRRDSPEIDDDPSSPIRAYITISQVRYILYEILVH